MGGHNDAAARSAGVKYFSVSLFSQKDGRQKLTSRKLRGKFKTRGLTQTRNTVTLITKKRRQTGDKKKEGLAFIDKRAGQQRDTGETHTHSVCCKQNCLLVIFRILRSDPNKQQWLKKTATTVLPLYGSHVALLLGREMLYSHLGGARESGQRIAEYQRIPLTY